MSDGRSATANWCNRTNQPSCDDNDCDYPDHLDARLKKKECAHEFDGTVLYSDPPKQRCTKCQAVLPYGDRRSIPVTPFQKLESIMPVGADNDALRQIYDVNGRDSFEEALMQMYPDQNDFTAAHRMSLRHTITNRPRRKYKFKGTRVDGTAILEFFEEKS